MRMKTPFTERYGVAGVNVTVLAAACLFVPLLSGMSAALASSKAEQAGTAVASKRNAQAPAACIAGRPHQTARKSGGHARRHPGRGTLRQYRGTAHAAGMERDEARNLGRSSARPDRLLEAAIGRRRGTADSGGPARDSGDAAGDRWRRHFGRASMSGPVSPRSISPRSLRRWKCNSIAWYRRPKPRPCASARRGPGGGCRSAPMAPGTAS